MHINQFYILVLCTSYNSRAKFKVNFNKIPLAFLAEMTIIGIVERESRSTENKIKTDTKRRLFSMNRKTYFENLCQMLFGMERAGAALCRMETGRQSRRTTR